MRIYYSLRKSPVASGLSIILLLMVLFSIAKAEILSTPLSFKSILTNSKLELVKSPVITSIHKPIPVNGTLVLLNKFTDNDQSLDKIRLPEAYVYLKDNAAQTVDEAFTQLDGKFDLVAPKSGEYQICWKVDNLTQGCKRFFKVEKKAVYLQQVLVQPTGDYVYGLSKMKEDRPCWLHDPFFAVDLYTKIDLINSVGNVIGNGVKANVAGEYAIGIPKPTRKINTLVSNTFSRGSEFSENITALKPALSKEIGIIKPIASGYRVRSSCEKSNTTSPQLVNSGNSYHIDLPINNHVPKALALAAFDGSKGITRADPNIAIESRLTARDDDLHSLTYKWQVLNSAGTVSNVDADDQQWTLPGLAGTHQVYVMARDGYGGYAFDRLSMVVGDPTLNFSGKVIDEVTRLPVKNARIDVLGEKTKTDDKGWFSLVVPELAVEQRYPLNINHLNYATYSRVLDKTSRGNTFELIRSQISFHNPENPIDIVDESSSGPCGRGNIDRDEQKHDRTEKDIKQDEVSMNRDCKSRGARLRLPARSLVYPDQSLAAGPIRLSMATLNPARRTLPGDYRAIDSNGDDTELVSFGALYAEFRDAFGNEVNLREGMEALLDVPISNDQAGIAKPTIPMWSYEEKSGFWIEEGEGKMVNTASGLMYQGPTKHFSTINMDVAGNDPNVATCVRLELDPSLNAWSNLTLRAYVTEAGSTASQVKETALDGDQYHAIYRIPYSNPPAGNTLRLELRGQLPSGVVSVLLNDIINTDARPKMTGTDLWPDYPYAECGDPIVLTADPVDLPYYGDIDATGRPSFLTGPYGQYLPSDPVQTSADYYAAIDPAGLKLNLGSWWVENGFGADGSGGTRASYLNHNDLGFGRDMHCLGDSNDYACYVTNYGLPDQNPANADDAETQNPATQGATVTMEHHSSAGNNAVSFYAYGGGVAGSTRISFADLDGLGPKPIPHLCMVCHGSDGAVLDSNDLVVNAKFREFDLPSFRYSSDRAWDYSDGNTILSATEFANFRIINDEVAAINSGNKIDELIDAWYPGVSNVPVLPAVPSNWTPGVPTADETSLYHNVYGKTCRTCHIARGFPDTYAQFVASSYVVCGQPKTMPNAFITYKNFWSDPLRVDEFETAINNFNCEQ